MGVRALVLAGACTLLAAFPSTGSAETATADEYVAAVRQDVVFLVEAGRLAEQRSASDKIRAFARAEAADEQRVADDLKFWDAERGLSSFAPSMLTASNDVETVTDTPDTIMTGRSAAIDPSAGPDWSRSDPGVTMASPGVVVMPQLTSLSGEAFDRLYKTTQAAALKELAGFYEAYSLTGKDATLKATAARQLPLVKQRLANLEAL